MALSTAVSLNRMSSVVGIQLEEGQSNINGSNLPEVIAIIGEANDANQGSFTPNVPVRITRLSQAATLFGMGSPLWGACRLCFPVTGGGTNADVWVIPQAEAAEATPRVQLITITGTATKSGTHYVRIAGRTNVDGFYYAVNIVSGDSATAVGTKIQDAINAVLGSPVEGSADGNVVACITKWYGVSAETLTVAMDDSAAPGIGISYAITEGTAGSGLPSIANAMTALGNVWYTKLINCYGAQSTILDTLEASNGVPGITGSTGRYSPIAFYPFVALTGTAIDNPTSISSGRELQCTNVICSASASEAMHYEIAAAYAVILTNTSINDPSQDVLGQVLADIPAPPAGTAIAAMQDYNTRDFYCKSGCATSILEKGVYVVKDVVTTYVDGTLSPQFGYVRNLTIDFNWEFRQRIMNIAFIIGKTICNDEDIVDSQNIVRPRDVKALNADLYKAFVKAGMFTRESDGVASILVQINGTNPNRIDQQVTYYRTGVGRITSTTNQANFNYGKI